MKRIILSLSIILTIIGIFCSLESASAQQANSLYFLEKTPFHNQWNPAMAPSNSGVGIGLSSFSISAQSDLSFDELFFPSQDGSELYSFLNPNVDKNAFISGLDNLSSFNTKIGYDIFNLGIRVKNNYFTIHSGLNIDAGMGIPKDLFKMLVLGMDENKDSTRFDLTDMNLNAMIYAKIGVGYSRKINDKISVGINVNYLYGLADMRLGFDKLTIDASETKWDVNTQGYIQMAVSGETDFTYNKDGYLNSFKYESNNLKTSSVASSSPKAGSGVSFDLGATVKPLPYLTLSAALLDLGSIKWDKKSVKRAKSNGVYSFEGVDLNKDGHSNTSDETVNSLSEMIHFEKDNNVEAYSSRLTTKLNIGAEAGILNDKITFGLLSQTGFATNGTYQDVMLSANMKPSGIIQGALTYSLLHGEQSAIGAALNLKLAFISFFMAADFIPMSYTPQGLPLKNSYYNSQFGFNLMF